MTARLLPTGTVTFLFSDMEGSTRLVQELGPADFTQVLERHNAILRRAYDAHGGVERGTQGDAFLVMFRDAPSAVAAAADAQQALAAQEWPRGAAVRVRMGLHTGVGILGGDDYVGVDVHRAARIAALAHGGQVLLSDASRVLAETSLPAGVTLLSVGELRLRDLAHSERLSQLVIDGLPSSFPPLRSTAPMAGNLPPRLTSFVGRERELAELVDLLVDRPLVTLTGPGGTGKSRLAVELARRLAGRFEHGAWFVSLEATARPELVPATIAASLSIVESPGTTAQARLIDWLADRSILLVFDNFEQVLDAAPMAAELTAASADLRVVVTSRAPLRLSIEQEYPVAPLGTPAADARTDEAATVDSVRLFVERAGRVRTGYAPAGEELRAVADICRRLDGLPLGIELAAARIGVLPAGTLAGRLAQRLDLPGGGARDLPARQQTLERAITWSHDLLDEPARRLLARLSVFSGGFRLEEAEIVVGPQDELGVELLDGLTTLVEQSLVQPTSGPDLPRFRLLETIRMFAAGKLAAAGDEAAARGRHAQAYRALAEEAASHMPDSGQLVWLDRLSADHDNLRAAINWATDTGDAETAHRLLAAAWRFWQFRGHVTEGRETADRVLGMPGADTPTAWRAAALAAAGGLGWWSGDVPAADAFYGAQLETARAAGNDALIADALFNLTHSAFALGRADEVEALQAEAERRYGDLGDERGVTRVRWSRGYALIHAGELEAAERNTREQLARFEELADEYYVAVSAAAMSGILFARGDLSEAYTWGIRSMRASQRLSDVASTTLILRSAACLWFAAGVPHEAAMLLGAYRAHRRRYGVHPPMDVEAWLRLGTLFEDMEAVMSGDEYRDDVERGAAMTTEEVVDFAAGDAALRLEASVRDPFVK